MKKTIISFVILLFFNSSASALDAPADRLFSNVTVLNDLQIEANFAEIFLNKNNPMRTQDVWHEGKIIVGAKTIATQIRLRGWSSQHICPFPKLMLKFKSKETQGTIFEGIKKLDLSTHCYPDADQSEKQFFVEMKYAHRESLIYEWLKILGIPAYKTRPAKITYVDRSATGALPTETHQAFFLQHLSEFKEEHLFGREIKPVNDRFRQQWELKNPDKVGTDEAPLYLFESPEKHAQLDRGRLAEVCLFEMIIGNNDWRMNHQELWNVKLFQNQNQAWVTVPLDFNLSALAMGRPPYMTSPVHDEKKQWYDLATFDQKKAIIEKFQSKIPELAASIEFLKAEDEVGYSSYQQTLQEIPRFLNMLRTQIGLPEIKK